MTHKQLEMFQADTTWFHIFKELIKSGSWAKMSSNAAKLYPVIKAFINWETGAAFPSLDTLQEYSGLARASVVKGLKELEEMGLLRKEGGQGSKKVIYTLVERFDIEDGDGRPTASVTFDYLPALVKDAVAEIRNFVAKGGQFDEKLQIIHIEHLNLQINQDNAQGTQNNLSATPEKIKELRSALEK